MSSSLRRLGPRWVELAQRAPRREGLVDDEESLVAAESLITSAPIDIAVREGLTAKATIALTDTKQNKDGKPKKLRPVRVEWLGDRDPALWNWVRAIEPRDASAEEIAASLWHGGQRSGFDGAASYYAYGLVMTGSLCALPPSWARTIPAAAKHAPKNDTPEEKSARLTALGSSSLADELALAQAGPAGHGDQIERTLEDVDAQLETITKNLAEWHLELEVTPAKH